MSSTREEEGEGAPKTVTEEQVSNGVTSQTQSEKLEVPSEELKLIRKQILVEKLMRSDSKGHKKKVVPLEEEGDDGITNSPEDQVQVPPAKLKTIKFQSSSVLSRAKEFLPLMKTENAKLFQRMKEDPTASKIELVDPKKEEEEDQTDSNAKGDEGPLIEMNLALYSDSDGSNSNSSSNEGEEVAKIA